MSKARVLICDDEVLLRLWLEEHLAERGFETEGVEDGASLLEAIKRDAADVVLLDLRLPDTSGIQLIPKLKEIDPSLPILMMTAHGDVETAVQAVRAGAHHFLEKPLELAELVLLIEQALETRRLASEVDRYREGTRWQFAAVTLVGRSFALRRAADLITRLAVRGHPSTVLIHGESGTGKDVVARAIHARGPRQGGPFINVNCTAIPESLVESELFGHEAGSFTDAREEKHGLFELADGGTIFLDEVGDMPLSGQSKLLNVLENKVLRRVGGVRDIAVDVHVVAATNRDLEAAVAAGDFREDLFYRLNVVPIFMPPLRERREDIAPLAMHFLTNLAKEMRLPERHFTPDALRALEAHDWPGNARQLRNMLERTLLLEDDDTIGVASLAPEIRGQDPHSSVPSEFVLPTGGVDLEDVEKSLILQALEHADGNKTQAAQLLRLTRDTFRYRVEKYGLGV